MHRLIVALLATVDAAIAVAVGLAATLAPLTLLWVFGIGAGADWKALWPASAVIWQFGNLVPVAVTIPADYVAATGIDPAAAAFTLSLAPLAFAAFTAIFAARSGVRASRADAWVTGVVSGSVLFAALATVVAVTSANSVAATTSWQAALFPTLVFALPALVAALVTEWREAGAGAIARLRDRIEGARGGWGETPGLIARGAAVVVVGLVGLGALLTAVGLLLKGGAIIALYEAAHLDVLGATLVTLAQLAYLPTLVVWGLTFVAGPGFSVGVGTTVSPAGTQLGVVPGIPLLGIVPETTTPWLLLLALCPVALGALAGWIARSRLTRVKAPTVGSAAGTAAPVSTDATTDLARTSALAGLLAASTAAREPEPTVPPEPSHPSEPEPIGARLVITLGIAILSAASAALLAVVASGSLGPGRLAVMGPAPGPVALAVGIEVILGAGILLLGPRGHRHERPAAAAVARLAAAHGVSDALPGAAHAGAAPDDPASDSVTEVLAGSPTDKIPAAAHEPPRPFTFPTLPRLPDSGRDPGASPGRGDADAPVD